MTRIFGRQVPGEIVALGIAEALLAFAVMYAVPGTSGAPALAPDAANVAAVLAFTAAATAAMIGLYRLEICLDRKRLLPSAALAGALAFPAALLVGGLLHPGRSASGLAVALMLWVACIVAIRSLFSCAVRRGWFVRRVLVLGCGRRAARMAGLLRRGAEFEPVMAWGLPLSAAALKAARIWCVVVAADDGGESHAEQLLDCKLRGIRVLQDGCFCELHLGRVDLGDADAGWLLHSDGFRGGRLYRASKRLADIVLGSAMLAAAAPVMLLTALLVRLDSRGAVLYRQERVGLDGKTFTLLKFRSMDADAEAAGAPRWAQGQDPRVTRVGAIIRPLRIDELPQLVNVLRGEMSLTGPRPERPQFVEELGRVIPFYHQRSYVKPGLTGWAQVNFRYGASVADSREKLAYDLYYMKNRSLVLDFLILLATVRVVLFREGAR